MLAIAPSEPLWSTFFALHQVKSNSRVSRGPPQSVPPTLRLSRGSQALALFPARL
jgi:hypothetical protein